MSTLANRQNNYLSPHLSESDNDDDNEQNSSYSQQNESMMNKVKDVVSKFLHPSFLFSANGDATRPKRKRSTEENSIEESVEPTINGHSTSSKLKSRLSNRRSPAIDDEPQLTDDDEDNSRREVVPIEPNHSEIEQQKKKRRTANYQHVVSTTTTNGHQENERTSPFSKQSTLTNGVGSFANRRMLDNDLTATNTTPVPSNEENIRLTTLTKQRLNISSTNRSLIANYDPSQSPLFSLNSRKQNESMMSPSRTTTNLKSNTNEFTSNYLLATGLANRSQTIVQTTTQLSSSPSTQSNRLLSNERQILGVNYSSINSRRLPYIERLRRRTLQDCIRLNRTLDSEPLSISTIEEHISTVASPIRKPVKMQEKECGIQCNISTADGSMEPIKKVQRTFPPPDIRNEALSVPILDKTQTTSQIGSNIETNSSITIEPIQVIRDITKPKVIGNITPFSWPKFARAQEEFAKNYPEKCRTDALPTQPSKPAVATSPAEKSNRTTTGQPTSTIVRIPILSMSPPRPVKPPAGTIWKCPSCSMEHPAQTASCSVCHGINPNYKRLSIIETTLVSSSSATKTTETIAEEPTVSKAATTFTPSSTTLTTEAVAITEVSATKESAFSVASVTTTTSFSAPAAFPTLGATSTTTTKETVTISFGSSSTTTPLFGTAATTADKPATSTSNSPFPTSTSTSSTHSMFGTLPSTDRTTTPSTSTSLSSTTTAAPPPIFGSFDSAPLSTSTASTTAPSTTLSDKPLSFTFGTTSLTPALAPTSSTSISAVTTASTTPNLCSLSSTTTATSSLSCPETTTASGFSFPNATPAASTSLSTATTTATVPLFGSNFTSTSASSSGFSFPPATTTTTASNSTPFTFGTSSPPKPFAPSVVSTSSTTTSTPAFGAASTFGTGSTTADKPVASIPSFSTFGSTSTPSSLFSFGASSNSTSTSTGGFAFTAPTSTTFTTSNGFGFPAPASSAPTTTSGFSFSAATTTAAPFGSAGGFSFTASTAAAPAAAPAPTFGTAPSTFAFGSAPSFSFGGSSTASQATNAPFQFSGVQSTATPPSANNSFSGGFQPTSASENNPFSVGEDSTSKRPVIKAKRRGKS